MDGGGGAGGGAGAAGVAGVAGVGAGGQENVRGGNDGDHAGGPGRMGALVGRHAAAAVSSCPSSMKRAVTAAAGAAAIHGTTAQRRRLERLLRRLDALAAGKPPGGTPLRHAVLEGDVEVVRWTARLRCSVATENWLRFREN